MTPLDAITREGREGLNAHAQIEPKDLKPLTCRIHLPLRLAPVLDIVQNIKSLPHRYNSIYRVPEIPKEQRCLSLGHKGGRGRVNYMSGISRPSVCSIKSRIFASSSKGPQQIRSMCRCVSVGTLGTRICRSEIYRLES